MSNKVEFSVVQHVPDLLRREPRNVGVVVSDGHNIVARFMGETAEGELDLRRVSSSIVPDKSLYAEWHASWRRALASDVLSSTPRIAQTGLANDVRFKRLLEGGKPGYEAQVIGDWYSEAPVRSQTDLESVLLQLYRRVVDSSALPLGQFEIPSESAFGFGRRSYAHALELETTITEVFRQHNILGQTPDVFTPHPVKLNYPVRGKNPIPHVPKFVQENGQRFVMEHVDFNVANPEVAREHAAYAAYMLTDVLKAAPLPGSKDSIVSIAIVNRVGDAEARRAAGGDAQKLVEAQEYGLAVLAGSEETVTLVHWDDEVSRKQFVDERIAIAHGRLDGGQSQARWFNRLLKR